LSSHISLFQFGCHDAVTQIFKFQTEEQKVENKNERK